MSADDHAWYDDIVMPALLETARRTYGAAIRRALHDAGFDDIPRRGMWIIGGIARNGPLDRTSWRRSGPSREARREQLVDTLLERGYVDAEGSGPLRLTPRGESAAAASAAAVAKVDAALVEHASAADVATLRRVLGTLADLAPDPT
jgi:hypothetical protein